MPQPLKPPRPKKRKPKEVEDDLRKLHDGYVVGDVSTEEFPHRLVAFLGERIEAMTGGLLI